MSFLPQRNRECGGDLFSWAYFHVKKECKASITVFQGTTVLYTVNKIS